MTRLIARLVLAMLLLPFTGALVILALAVVTMLTPTGDPHPLPALGMWSVVYSFIAIYWILLWRPVVRWTARRKALTAAAGLCAIAGGAAVGFLLMVSLRAPAFAGILFGGGVVPIIWVCATVFIWRETALERMERISAAGGDTLACPICGYNMTGLRESRCPECGASFTLDELVAGQTREDPVALERE